MVQLHETYLRIRIQDLLVLHESILIVKTGFGLEVVELCASGIFKLHHVGMHLLREITIGRARICCEGRGGEFFLVVGVVEVWKHAIVGESIIVPHLCGRSGCRAD